MPENNNVTPLADVDNSYQDLLVAGVSFKQLCYVWATFQLCL